MSVAMENVRETESVLVSTCVDRLKLASVCKHAAARLRTSGETLAEAVGAVVDERCADIDRANVEREVGAAFVEACLEARADAGYWCGLRDGAAVHMLTRAAVAKLTQPMFTAFDAFDASMTQAVAAGDISIAAETT